jgi:bacillolysin
LEDRVHVRRTLVAGLAVSLGVVVVLSHGAVRAQSRPARSIAATDPASLRSWDSTVDSMVRDGSLQLRRTTDDTLISDRAHERLNQYYKGIRVHGGDIARQTERGVSVSIFGTMYPDINLGVDPALTTSDAAAIVKRESGVDLGPSKMPQLLILPQDNGYRLVYHAKAYTLDSATEYFIDANDGSLVMTLDAAQRQTAAVGVGTGVLNDQKKMSVTAQGGLFFADDSLRPPLLWTIDMHQNLQRTLDFLNGLITLNEPDRASDSDNKWTDGATVDAHAYVGYTYDYYYKRFGRKGLDNNNIQLASLVHPVDRNTVFSQPGSILGLFFVNAFYAGDGIMVYGEGLPTNVTLGGQFWNYLAGALDVTAHELSHGVTEFTSNLIYQGESGALNESFSDMMGTSVEFFYQPAGSGPMKADYLIGEDVVTPGGLRSMANPNAFGDPDHYSRRYIGPLDNGGVHTNSAIGNQWFYLAIEGGTNRTSGLQVTGVGSSNREQIERVVYRAFTQLMPANATYSTARAVTIQAANDLYGASSAATRAVTQAWAAMGVN